MAAHFIWNGIDSQSKKILVRKLPDIIRPAQRTTEVIVPGRSGVLRTIDGGYDQVIRACECVVMKGADIDDICDWLLGGGNVTFSNQPDRYFKAYISNQIPFGQVLRGNPHRSFIVQFFCEPFGYVTDASIITMTTGGIVINPCNIYSDPKITVYGNGDIDLVTGNNIVFLSDVNDSITIDSEMMDVYKENEFLNHKMSGHFPVLPVGGSSIIWSGDVIKVVIEPRWRWL